MVVGGGSAGSPRRSACGRRGPVALVERDPFLGGILLQCIHSGFGIHEFGEDLTGPEYAERFIGRPGGGHRGVPGYDRDGNRGDPNADGRRVTARRGRTASFGFSTRAVVLAMGCRERNRGNVAIAGTRPAGVFTAGLAQRLVNIEGCVPGKHVVIVGSGDIGLIMARRLTWSGCSVRAVVEIQPYPSGSVRNIAQCLNDYSIPLHLGHVVTMIEGKDRVEAVSVAPIADGSPDARPGVPHSLRHRAALRRPDPGKRALASGGCALNEDTSGPWVDADMMTGAPGHLRLRQRPARARPRGLRHRGGARCADRAAVFLSGSPRDPMIPVTAGANVKCVVPNACAPGRQNVFFLRSLVVKNDARLEVRGRAGAADEEAGTRAAL